MQLRELMERKGDRKGAKYVFEGGRSVCPQVSPGFCPQVSRFLSPGFALPRGNNGSWPCLSSRGAVQQAVEGAWRVGSGMGLSFFTSSCTQYH
jgi:hypothetical protein